MIDRVVAGKSILTWKKMYPILNQLMSLNEVFWVNPEIKNSAGSLEQISLTAKDVEEAEARLQRFAPYIAKAFPETADDGGIIESPLLEVSNLKSVLEERYKQKILGRLLLKCDHALPIAGSIKARGGIYEVLKHAEDLAFDHQLLTKSDDYSLIDSDTFRDFYSHYSISVGSTGNLGLSIGMISAKLGFKVTVHMSHDAKQWKKDLLRSRGATVVEHSSDYSEAVKIGRKLSEADPNSYFVDDENSPNLFLGYAVAASRLKRQLDRLNICVDKDHPLFVYLPCGVGGAPGGIAFGLKLVFKDAVHCFFAEPTHSPCMLLGLMTGLHDRISVQDFGLDNQTAADGLAVGRPSGFAGKVAGPLISGIYTVSDSLLFNLLSTVKDAEGISLEPSALAGVIGPVRLMAENVAAQKNLTEKMRNAIHIPWATGGSLVPGNIMEEYYLIGKTKSPSN